MFSRTWERNPKRASFLELLSVCHDFQLCLKKNSSNNKLLSTRMVFLIANLRMLYCRIESYVNAT